MYIINTTFVVDNQDQTLWLDIIKDKYVPFLRKSGFEKLTFTRIISIEAVQQFTYSLQIEADDIKQYQLFEQDIFTEYTSIASPLFGDRVLWFTSLMKKIELNE